MKALITSFINGLVAYPLIASLLFSLTLGSIMAHGQSETQMPQPPRQINPKIDEKSALNLVWQLPAVQRKVREISTRSNGKVRVRAMVDSKPTAEAPYYTVRIAENHADAIRTIYWFRVLVPSGKIQVLDIIRDQYVPVEKWQP
jgi:hypothetical protein